MLGNNTILNIYKSHGRLELHKHMNLSKIEKQVEKIFQIKISKSKEQKCLAIRIKYTIIKINHDTRCTKKDK